MEIKKIILLTFCFLFSSTVRGYTAWTGPTTIVAGTWGTGTTQFGLETGDSPDDDNFPGLDAILGNGDIVIGDLVNKRTEVYTPQNAIKIVIPWNAQHQPDGSIIYSNSIPKYLVGSNDLGYDSNQNLWSGGDNYFALISITGDIVTTSSTRPMELGILSQKITGTSHYKRIEYPDAVYFYYYTGSTEYFPYDSGIIRINTNLIMDVHNGFQPARVYAFTATAIQTPAGQKQQYQLFLNSSWVAPLPQYKPVERPSNWPPNAEPPPQGVAAEYGSAVIGPDGSIYTYDRSDTEYKIVKWTWTP